MSRVELIPKGKNYKRKANQIDRNLTMLIIGRYLIE